MAYAIVKHQTKACTVVIRIIDFTNAWIAFKRTVNVTNTYAEVIFTVDASKK